MQSRVPLGPGKFHIVVLVWNNKDITVEQRSIFKKDLFSKGIVTIGDLLSDAGIFLKGVKSRKQVPAMAQKLFTDKFSYFSFNWNAIYSFPFIVTKIREFQYKVLNNIVFTNEKLFKFKILDSPLCSFCKREVESLEHLFYYCDVTKTF